MKNYKPLQNGSDIRGVALPGDLPVNIDETASKDLSRAFCAWLSEKTGKAPGELVIAVGRDSRISGPQLAEWVCSGIHSCGAKALNCGMASTPAMFMACRFPEIAADGSIMITASHLPMERNGFKYFTAEGGLDKPDISRLIAIAEDDTAFPTGSAAPEPGSASGGPSLMKLYADHLKTTICRGLIPEGADEKDITVLREIQPLKGLHVVVDAGNGAGGFFASEVLEPLGADISGSRYLEPDGTFPNHQPNPENAQAMDSICQAVKESGADLGIIFDTDVDRASAVDSKGQPIARNEIVALSAVLAAEGHPGTTIVTDSITSTQLSKFLAELGLKHLRFKRGYKNVINKGLELNAAGTDCQLAIETSGHAALKENYFLDDGAYLATKIVVKAAQLKAQGKYIEDCIAGLEKPAEAAEYRLPLTAENFAEYADSVMEGLKAAAVPGSGMSLELPNYEGIRINLDKAHGDGWLLIRKSLHEPLMPVNIESNQPGGVEIIKKSLAGLLEGYEKLDISKLK